MLNFRYRNLAKKTIVQAEFGAAWLDVLEEAHRVGEVVTIPVMMKPGATREGQWHDPPFTPRESVGWLIFPVRIVYEDGSSWQITPKDKQCFGSQMWGKKKAPKELPPAVFDSVFQ